MPKKWKEHREPTEVVLNDGKAVKPGVVVPRVARAHDVAGPQTVLFLLQHLADADQTLQRVLLQRRRRHEALSFFDSATNKATSWRRERTENKLPPSKFQETHQTKGWLPTACAWPEARRWTRWGPPRCHRFGSSSPGMLSPCSPGSESKHRTKESKNIAQSLQHANTAPEFMCTHLHWLLAAEHGEDDAGEVVVHALEAQLRPQIWTEEFQINVLFYNRKTSSSWKKTRHKIGLWMRRWLIPFFLRFYDKFQVWFSSQYAVHFWVEFKA